MVFFWVELNLLKVAFLARKRGNELRKTLKTKTFFLRGGVKEKKPHASCEAKSKRNKKIFY